jgi:hypothetical protein
MGQANLRKAEIAALKANGSKKIKPFILRGSIINGQVVYDTAGLEPAQASFVNGCVKTINEQMIPESKETPTQETHLTFVSWHTPQDFIGFLSGPFDDTTPDAFWEEALMTFKKGTSKYPQVGCSYTLDEIIALSGTDTVSFMFHSLREGGIWPWPNAHAVFEKRGDKLVVIDTI